MALRSEASKQIITLGQRHPALLRVLEELTTVVEILASTVRAHGKILLCGNGGSAADCEHIAGELMKGFCMPRRLLEEQRARFRDAGIPEWEKLADALQRGIPAITLTGHPSLATAVINDNAPEHVFAQQVMALGRPGDVLIGISTSGNAKNVLAAAHTARALGLQTIGLTGSRGGHLAKWCDRCIRVPAEETFHVQELHLPVYHALCLALEAELMT